ncbi:MAG: ABC transporter ATP-binding protein [Gemmatimonadota bacterium]|jgi:ABC-2 type transport system ATP-binding protein/lipopolysaccharide transport system ATP-binding protein|nr:ABC transporter ATP-binding protein [Gemmatimonadota bacterium]
MHTDSDSPRVAEQASERPPALLLSGVSVAFESHRTPAATLKEHLIRWTKRDLEKKSVRALDGLDLRVDRGEVFGIVGRNGAGKSTLLRVISGILHPSRGRVRVWGKVTPLLGVGAGFHGDLTGRENIALYSAILGRSPERTRELVDDIIRFSELADFIDAPLRVYSAGMSARLGFAVALAESPEVLLVDEVLGVGDEQFRRKCRDRFEEIRKAGATIVIVTHSMSVAKEMCDRLAWIENGKVRECGTSEEVAASYVEFQKAVRSASTIRPR